MPAGAVAGCGVTVGIGDEAGGTMFGMGTVDVDAKGGFMPVVVTGAGAAGTVDAVTPSLLASVTK